MCTFLAILELPRLPTAITLHLVAPRKNVFNHITCIKEVFSNVRANHLLSMFGDFYLSYTSWSLFTAFYLQQGMSL